MTTGIDADMLACQVDSLRAALVRVLDTRDNEAQAWMSYQVAQENYTNGAARECRIHERAMLAASTAEREARTLLLTLKTPNGNVTGAEPVGGASGGRSC